MPSHTWENGESVLYGRDVDPTVIILSHTSGTLRPVGVRLVFIGRPDEQPAYIILGSDDKQTVVSVTADATTCLSLSICLVVCRESAGFQTLEQTRKEYKW